MFFRFSHKTKKATVIIALILVVGLLTARAVSHDNTRAVVKKGGSGQFFIVNDGPNQIKVTVEKGALDDYLQLSRQSAVKITTELKQAWVDKGNGDGYYRLDFTFQPSGAYFHPPLELQLSGIYFTQVVNATLYDEEVKPLLSSRHPDGNQITYYIPHFSSYSYDHYDDSPSME